MEFLGFGNNDFDFFKKKGAMNKAEYEQRKEELKRHFREFCYEIQKNYHSVSGGTLLLERNFQGIGKSNNCISATSKIECLDSIVLSIDFSQQGISIGLICPADGDYLNFEKFYELIISRKDIFTKFFKENREMHIMLCRKNFKKSADIWIDDIKIDNTDLIHDDFKRLIDSMNKLKSTTNGKMSPGMHIRVQYSKTDTIRIGKLLSSKACGEIIKLLNLCEAIK